MNSLDVHFSSRLARVMCALVRAYQRFGAGRVSPCRHVPGCSTYAIQAFELHGAFRGLWLVLKRVCRCQPWGTSGYDPVPLASES
ncbi:MAG: membrane protein insertion efficiency factor YidD [Acidimicrobiia bacterium]|nr:membrane protein insertion efficiency factor YidD [Acidimicrobiia bacterium]MCY4456578.1 membrane protein insertion efficiency factor YidD [Acidimicrobiaceae bacterium]